MGRWLLAWVRLVVVTFSIFGWGLGVLGVAAWIGLGATGVISSTELLCAGDSNAGKASWSWFPLGHDCTWTEEADGFDLHDPAGPWLSIVVVTLAVSGVVLERAWRGLDPVWDGRRPSRKAVPDAGPAPVPGPAREDVTVETARR